jgi:perosamine synthetase
LRQKNLIPINIPRIGEEEIKAVVKVMSSGQLTNALGAGPTVTHFENNFAEFAGVKHAIAMNTGTAALHSALVAAGVKKGDEVILPSFTFVATVEAVIMAGGKPVFTDINPESYHLSPHEIEKNLTKNTKAILPVDLYGLPVDIKPIKEIADEHDLVIVEDAAQAHGAIYSGKSAGAFSDAASWSFYASKNITTGEGGLVTTNNDEIAETLRLIRTHGEKTKYASVMLGYNYRMSEIQAAIGMVQLKRLPLFLSKRRENAKRLSKLLAASDRLQLPEVSEEQQHSWYLYTVRLSNATENERNKILEQLRQKEIGSEVYYATPVHLMSYYITNFGKHELPQTEKAAKQVFSLPIHPGVTKAQIDYIGNTLLKLL